MKRIHWFIAGGVLAAGVAVAVVALLRHPAVRPVDDEEPPPGYVPVYQRIQLPGDDGVAYDQGKTIRAPDQPGWKTRVGHEFYGLSMLEFVVAARRSERLGQPDGTGEIRRVDPFVLAALPWEDDDIEEWRPFAVIGVVAQMLRKEKIVAFGNPMMLTFPREGLANAGWKDPHAVNWIGIPVPRGARIPEPLKAIEFAGAEVRVDAVPFERVDPASDWDDLIAAVAASGRQPMLPLLRRWSGFNLHEPAIQVQRMVPLKPVPAPQ